MDTIPENSMLALLLSAISDIDTATTAPITAAESLTGLAGPTGPLREFSAHMGPFQSRDVTCSCTLFFMVNNETMDSHILPKLLINSQFLNTSHEGIISIRLSSLLFTIREGAHLFSLPPTFQNILDDNSHSIYDVATIRLPDFTGTHRNLANTAYRFLGNLSQTPFLMERMVSTEIDSAKDVIAVGSYAQDSAIMKAYMDSCAPFGVQRTTHFIIMFSPATLSPSLDFTSPSTSAFSSPNTASPNTASDQFFYSTTSSPSASPNDESYPNSVNQHPNSVNQRNATSSPIDRLSAGLKGMTVAEIEECLLQNGISPEQIKLARYNSSTKKSLYFMVQNFRMFQNVLEVLGYRSGKLPPFHKDDRLFSIAEHFNWKYHTFIHKFKWYSFAEEMAGMTWNVNDRPLTDEESEFKRIWKSSKYFFGPGGFIAMGNPPSLKSATTAIEVQAAKLTQTDLSSAETQSGQIRRYLTL